MKAGSSAAGIEIVEEVEGEVVWMWTRLGCVERRRRWRVEIVGVGVVVRWKVWVRDQDGRDGGGEEGLVGRRERRVEGGRWGWWMMLW